MSPVRVCVCAFWQVRPLIHEDFVAALPNIRASVSSEDLQMYVEWNRRFGTGGAR